MSYDVSKHTGVYHHCAACRKVWQAADLSRTAFERWTAHRTPPSNSMLGRAVRARVAYGFSPHGGGRYLVRDVAGTVWSEAAEGMASSKGRAYWIANGGSDFYVALETHLEERAS